MTGLQGLALIRSWGCCGLNHGGASERSLHVGSSRVYPNPWVSTSPIARTGLQLFHSPSQVPSGPAFKESGWKYNTCPVLEMSSVGSPGDCDGREAATARKPRPRARRRLPERRTCRVCEGRPALLALGVPRAPTVLNLHPPHLLYFPLCLGPWLRVASWGRSLPFSGAQLPLRGSSPWDLNSGCRLSLHNLPGCSAAPEATGNAGGRGPEAPWAPPQLRPRGALPPGGRGGEERRRLPVLAGSRGGHSGGL